MVVDLLWLEDVFENFWLSITHILLREYSKPKSLAMRDCLILLTCAFLFICRAHTVSVKSYLGDPSFNFVLVPFKWQSIVGYVWVGHWDWILPRRRISRDFDNSHCFENVFEIILTIRRRSKPDSKLWNPIRKLVNFFIWIFRHPLIRVSMGRQPILGFSLPTSLSKRGEFDRLFCTQV